MVLFSKVLPRAYLLSRACLPRAAVALPPDGFAFETAASPLASDAWEFYSYHASGSFRDCASVNIEVDDDDVVSGRGVRQPEFETKTSRDEDLFQSFLQRSHAGVILFQDVDRQDHSQVDSLGEFALHGLAKDDRGCRVLRFSKTYGTEHEHRAGSSGHVAHVVWGGADAADGFFGVWEGTSSDTHFELRRGGCCRLLPMSPRGMLPLVAE